MKNEARYYKSNRRFVKENKGPCPLGGTVSMAGLGAIGNSGGGYGNQASFDH
jgi:hypothetical protein